MKKIAIIYLILMSYNSFSQLEKGRMMLDGNFNIQRNEATNFVTDTINGLTRNIVSEQRNLFGLNYGFFIKNNLMLGIGGNYSHSVESALTAVDSYSITRWNYTSNRLQVSLFARYYQFVYKNRLALYGDATLFVSGEDSFSKTTFSGQFVTSYGLRFSPGISFFAKRWLAFNASFGAVSLQWEERKNHSLSGVTRQTTKQFQAASNLGVSLSTILFGISFYFGGHKTPEATEEKKQ